MTEPTPITTITACPECGGRDLKIQALEYVTAYVRFRGSEGDHEVYDTKGGSIEWGDDAPVECCACGHEAAMSDFEIPLTEEEENDDA